MRWAVVVILLSVGVPSIGGILDDPRIIFRGDANNDGNVDWTDATFLNDFLFKGGPEPPCMANADVNDDGQIDGADPSFLLDWLFQGGSAPPAPGPWNPFCDPDPTKPYLGCLDYWCE